MRKDPTEFRKRFAAWKNGKLPYKDGKPVVLNNYTNAKFNDDGTFTDDTTRVFDDFYVTPSGVKTKYGSYTDKNWDRYKQQETFFRTHDQQTGNLKYEPGLEIVSPEYDILTLGAGARTNAATQTFLKNRKIANAIAKGIKNNPVLKVYNSNPSYLDTGGNVLQYLDYINSLFPNSKIKDIVYHSTWAKPFEQFDPSRIKRGYGFYFSPSENHLPFDRMVYSRVNILNPLEIFPNKNRNLDVSGLWRKDLTELAIKNGQHDGVIGVSNMRNPGEPEIVALNPEQVHILGSGKDKKMFRYYVEDSGIKSWASVLPPKPYIRKPYEVIGESEGNPVRLLTNTTNKLKPHYINSSNHNVFKNDDNIVFNEKTGNFELKDNTADVPSIFDLYNKVKPLTAKNITQTPNPFKYKSDIDTEGLFKNLEKIQIKSKLAQIKSPEVNSVDDPYGILNVSHGVVHHEGMPKMVENLFRHLILPRTNINPLEYDRVINILSKYGYNTLDDYRWAKYVDDNLAGYLDNATNAIALRDGYIDFAAAHEFRHRMLRMIPYKRSLAIDRESYLNLAYGDEFVDLPKNVDPSDSLYGYTLMKDEAATTNLDARKWAFENLSDNPNIGNLSVKEQNEFLDGLSDDDIILAVVNSNGYGKRYVRFLELKYNLLNNPKLNALWARRFRNAMKYYGMASIPITLANTQN